MSSSLPVAYRASLHLKDRNATALTDQIALTRDCYAAEIKQGWARIHAAVVIPQAIYLIWSLRPDDDPLTRLARMGASFRTHSNVAVDWHWPVVGPLAEGEVPEAVEEAFQMPVAWGLCTRAEDWPYSSIHRRAPQYEVA